MYTKDRNSAGTDEKVTNLGEFYCNFIYTSQAMSQLGINFIHLINFSNLQQTPYFCNLQLL